MANTGRYDLWVKAIDRQYPNIPFTTLTDWIQEGRLLETDQVRPAGSTQWTAVRDEPLLTAYFPRAEPIQAGDQAEALEPVELGFAGKKRAEEEEEDPDMIPLIDISLVLLVFFMMTAADMISAMAVETPPAENARVIEPRKQMTVGMSLVAGEVKYFFGEEAAPLSQKEALDLAAAHMQGGGLKEAIVKANPTIPYETVHQLLMGLEKLGVERIEAGVRDSRKGEEQP